MTTRKLWVLAFLLAGVTGCQTVNSSEYTRGVIQSRYQPSAHTGTSRRLPIRIAIPEFSDQRGEQGETNTLWMSAVPGVSLGARWHQRDYLRFDPLHYGGYKSAHRDLSELFVRELGRAGLFAQVRAGDYSPVRDEVLLQGKIEELSLDWRPHFQGLSAWLGIPAAVFGMPIGRALTSTRIHLALVNPHTHQAIWEKTYANSVPTTLAFYYGHDPMRCGPPATELFGPIIRAAQQDLQQAVAAKEPSFWLGLAHQSPTPPSVIAAPAAPTAYRQVHVLVIGVGRYEDRRIPALEYADADAKAMYEFFCGPLSPARPENVHLLIDKPNADGLKADRGGILAAIRKYLIENVHKDSLAILYYSGHGDAGTAGTRDANVEYYLVPMDARSDNLVDTAISLDAFQRRWDEIDAGLKVFIADSCNSGGFVSIKGITVKGVSRMAEGQRGTVVFAASQPGEKALGAADKRRSLFTQVLLDGLGGKADLPVGYGDGSLTIGELKLWLEQHVPARARKMGASQTPVVKVPAGRESVYLTK